MQDARRTIVFYGNCQAGALSLIMGSHPVIAERFTVRHLPNFDDPATTSPLGAADVVTAAVLFEQYDPVPFPYRSSLPFDCVSATFPSIDFNLLWPFTRNNPYNDRSDPTIPWGEFPYGDRVLIEAIDRDLDLEEALEYYHRASIGALPNLDRLEKLERARLVARDAKCDVRFADFIFDRFRETQLHWCVNHPTMTALLEMCRRLLAAIGGDSSPIGRLAIEDAGATQLPREPLDLINVPVHPEIAKRFELHWYEASAAAYGLYDSHLTYEQYIRRMAAAAIAERGKIPTA